VQQLLRTSKRNETKTRAFSLRYFFYDFDCMSRDVHFWLNKKKRKKERKKETGRKKKNKNERN